MSSNTISMQQHLAQMGFLEKIGIVPKLGYTLSRVLLACFTGIFRGKRPATLYRYVAYTAMRTLIASTTLKQQHYINPTDDVAYKAFCKNLKLQPESEALPDGTLAYWIGSKTASKIIVNFHGGGYVLPASPEMFQVMLDLVQYVNKQGKDVACLFLSYDLAPQAKYPRQLEQATALVSHIINNLNKKPSDLIFTGDSAGANLITQLLSHISHPHPEVAPLTIPEKFRAVVLISPWISFDTSKPSFTRNKYTDIIAVPAGKKWSSAFMKTPWPHNDSTDFYNQAFTAPVSWWEGTMVDEVLVLGGEDEVLIDSIKEFAATLKKVLGDKVTEVYCAGEMHDQPNLDLLIGFKEPCEQTKAMWHYVAERV